MSTATLVAGPIAKLGRTELAQISVPQATATHKPVPHHTIVEALIETLSFRHIGVVNDEYSVSSDGMKMFGVLDLETQMDGCRFAIGVRNSHDKSLRLGLTAGLRVFVCDGKIVGWFQGGSELGPRALGQRSIFCDPRPAEMKGYLNSRVKFREAFRPFAPMIMEEEVCEWFETSKRDDTSSFMLRVLPFRKQQ
jgi:hypothetical protein